MMKRIKELLDWTASLKPVWVSVALFVLVLSPFILTLYLLSVLIVLGILMYPLLMLAAFGVFLSIAVYIALFKQGDD
tara:strand:- start:69 stop:299 length:231 start_codon:yes stop_codon:yes gene_type:complete